MMERGKGTEIKKWCREGRREAGGKTERETEVCSGHANSICYISMQSVILYSVYFNLLNSVMFKLTLFSSD